MHRTRIKICGIANRNDAEAAIAAGADALGFNTWGGSRRFIDLEVASGWLRELPPFVTRVALLVNAPFSDAERVASLPYIDAVQLHGDEDGAYCAAVARRGVTVIKAIRPKTREDLSQIGEFGGCHILIDAYVPGHFGGSGVRADLALALELNRTHPHLSLILAGGLKPENVAAVVRQAMPYAVDVSSGVERQPGRKDPELLSAFVWAVREADADCRADASGPI